MIKSMTGYASISREDERGTLAVTVRALNHRHLDIQCRLPPAVAPFEQRIRSVVQRHIARGRIEVVVWRQLRQVPVVEVELNESFVDALAGAVGRARERGLIAGELTPGDLLRFPQAIAIRERPPDEDTASEAVGQAVEQVLWTALGEVETMRTQEGRFLGAELEKRLAMLEDLARRIAAAADAGRAGLEERLAQRVRDLAVGLAADSAAIAQEIVRTAARSDITEELVRLSSHIAHWRALAETPEPCGRKLEFLLQEMNREVNTIGSKAEGTEIPELVVTAKAELERLREQVQNVE